MPDDEPIHLNPTHAVSETEGKILGLDLSRMKWVLLALLAGLVPGWLLSSAAGFAWASLVVFGPALVVAAFQILFLQNRPNGWITQWVQTRLTGAHLSPLRGGVTFRPVVEAYCADGAMAFPGPEGKLWISRGFHVSLPESRSSANRVRNEVGQCLSHVLATIPEGGRIQFRWEVINHFGDRLHEYARATPPDAPAAIQRYRNLKAVHMLQAIEAGQLRRESVTLSLGHEIHSAKPTRAERKDPGLFYSGVLAEAASGTAKLGAAIEAALAPIGGTLEALGAQAVASAWHRTLNPSAASRRLRISPPPEPTFSLTDLCWGSELRGLADRGFHLDEYHAVFTLRSLPGATYQGIVDHLTTLPIPGLAITVLAERLPKERLIGQLQSRLRRIQRQLEQRHDPLLNVSRAQIDEKLAQLARGAIVPLNLEMIIVLHAPTTDELRRHSDLLKNAVARIGATLFEASLAATARNLFLKTLLGWLWSRDPGFIHYAESGYARDLLCISSAFEAHLDNQPEALLVGPHQNLIGVRMFVGEGNALTPQHCFIAGANGVGKSFFLLWLLMETAPYHQYTAIIEEGLSQKPFTEAMGAAPIIVTPDCLWTFNPLSTGCLPLSSLQRSFVTALACRMIGVSQDEDKAHDDQALISKHVGLLYQNFADEWLRRQPEAERVRIARHAMALHQLGTEAFCDTIESFVTLRDELATNPEMARRRLDTPSESEVRTFASKHRDAVRELAFAFMREYPTLSALREELAVAGAQDQRCLRLADRIRPWCAGGMYGRLFDGQSNITLDGPVAHFELGRIQDAAKDLKVVVGFLLINIIRHHLLTLPRSFRKRVVIEEVARFLEVPGGENILRELVAQFRKFHVQIIIVGQQISQIQNPSLRSVVLGNMRMAFIFHPGDPQDLDLLAEYLPISDAAKAMILRYPRPDQLRGAIYSECCYLHLTAREPYCGTIRFVPIDENQLNQI